jgi:PEGA domain
MIAILSGPTWRFPALSSAFGSGASTKSVIIVILLGLGVCGLFGYLYLREWYLNRLFRRLGEMKPATTGEGAASCALPAPRPPLVRLERPHSFASTEQTGSNGGGANGNRTRRFWLRSSPAGGFSASFRRGLLEISAENGSCEVFIDGAFFGNTPAKLRLPEGAHVVEIKSPGFEEYRREIQVVEGSELKLRPRLEPDGAVHRAY